MTTIISLIFSCALILAGPEFLWAKAAPKTAPKPPQSVQDLETTIVDLQENTKDLRHNITSWQKIQWDANLTLAEKMQWRHKAQDYLQECEAYNDLLARVDAKKLPKSEVSRRFLTERQTFQRELESLRETMQKP